MSVLGIPVEFLQMYRRSHELNCEDSLLYYEACVSSHAPVVYAPAPVKGPGKGPVALPSAVGAEYA